MRSRLFFVAAALLASSLAAHADTQMFDLSGVLKSGPSDTFSGTVTIDTTNGIVTDSNFTADHNGTAYSFSGAPAASGPNHGNYFAGFGSLSTDYFVFNLPVVTLVGYTGGPLCSQDEYCSVPGGEANSGWLVPFSSFAVSGSLTLAASATPEPSSLALLGTGLLGAVGVIRRRLA